LPEILGSPGGVLQVSDISVGYGNFDSLSLIDSVCEHYGLPGLIVEPDQPDKPIQTEVHGLQVHRIGTSQPFRSLLGRIEFTIRAAEIIRQVRPHVLIIRCSWNIPILLKIGKKPPMVIYHSTESTLYYGDQDPAFNRLAAPMIDLLVFPEENRAARDIERCGFQGIPVAIAYNSPARRADLKNQLGSKDRNGRILYSGALDRNATYTDYYSRPEMAAIPVDIYGYIGGSDPDATRRGLERLSGALRYMGYVDTEELRRARKKYAYSITIWNPSNENQHFACPCKFFEALADAVPPITAPHPQCRMIVERYQCGFVMNDWSFESFSRAMETAMSSYGTSAYDRMVENCRAAMEEELNWDHQFARVRPLLAQVLEKT
jgi:glycosyltransferase involved in cell wall biosynthesis